VAEDAWPSIDLSHLGLDVDVAGCAERLARIARRLSAGRRIQQVGAEDHDRADAILERVLAVAGQGLADRLGATVQANLRRAPTDLERLVAAGVHIRLVKGAYVESMDRALPYGEATDIAYLHLAHRLAKADAPFALATHDGVLREALLAALGLHPVEQLLGVRLSTLDDLVARGVYADGHTSPSAQRGFGTGCVASPSPGAAEQQAVRGSAIIRAKSNVCACRHRPWGSGGAQKLARWCRRFEVAAAVFGAGLDDAEGIAPWVAGVEGALAPGLAGHITAGVVQDGAGVDDALTDGFERLARAQVDVTGVGSREGWVPVGDRIPAGQQNPIAIEVVASGGDPLAVGSEQRSVEHRRSVDVSDRHDHPKDPHELTRYRGAGVRLEVVRTAVEDGNEQACWQTSLITATAAEG